MPDPCIISGWYPRHATERYAPRDDPYAGVCGHAPPRHAGHDPWPDGVSPPEHPGHVSSALLATTKLLPTRTSIQSPQGKHLQRELLPQQSPECDKLLAGSHPPSTTGADGGDPIRPEKPKPFSNPTPLLALPSSPVLHFQRESQDMSRNTFLSWK